MPFRIVLSRVINAPLSFVYDWWTDYRADDPHIVGKHRRLSILERTGRRVIMSTRYKSHGRFMTAARIVSLKPPDFWHLDWIGDEYDEIGDYKLTRLGANRTRLKAVFRIDANPRTAKQADFQRGGEASWNRYIARLERDYRSKRRKH